MRVMSFAFKSGVPGEASLVLDARCLSNPHGIYPGMTGLDKEVQDWLLASSGTGAAYMRMRAEAVEHARRNPNATIAIGCHGGRHRSVAMAEWIARSLRCEAHHRELNHTTDYGYV